MNSKLFKFIDEINRKFFIRANDAIVVEIEKKIEKFLFEYFSRNVVDNLKFEIFDNNKENSD